jgi:hypothetical protein
VRKHATRSIEGKDAKLIGDNRSIMGNKSHSIDLTKFNELVQIAIASSKSSYPGIVFQCVDCHGGVLASAVSGVRDIATGQDMTLDTVFWIASCTKLVTSIACMQLVERGKAELDDPGLVARILPEVGQAKVLVDGEEREQKQTITLKMLLTHTCKSILLLATYKDPGVVLMR